MTIGNWVEWTPPELGNIKLNPMRGWVVAIEGDWAVVRVSHMRSPQSPFATFHHSQLTILEELPLVQRGAALLS